MTNTAVTTTTQQGGMEVFFQSPKFTSAVAQALPKHCTQERFTRMALTALIRNPGLAKCTQESLFEKMVQLASLGIEPDGRRAHLIPMGNTATLIIDYKGIAELVLRSGEVASLQSDVVCENDDFEYNLGEVVRHKIDFRIPRGSVYAVYARARMHNGAIATVCLSKDEVEAVRKRSRSSGSGPWVTDWNEMAKKTAFRRLSKWLPLSPDIRSKVEVDDEDFEFDDIKPAVVAPNFMAPDPAPAAPTPKRGRPAKAAEPAPVPTPEPEPEAAIEVETVIEPPIDAPAGELTALVQAQGVTWPDLSATAAEMGWFGNADIPDAPEKLSETHQAWLKKNMKGVCAAAKRFKESK